MGDGVGSSAAAPRLAKRMTCAVSFGEQRYTGVVLNVSQSGLFVQTSAPPVRGEDVELELNPPGEEQAIPLRAEVVWRRVVPTQLRSSARGGMGVRIVSADESYYNALADWMRVSLERGEVEAGPEAAAEPSRPSWRVRVRASGTVRTRFVTVEAESDDTARAAALDYLGSGWQVLDVDAL